MSKQAEYRRRQTTAAGNVGKITRIANLKRRESCRDSLRKFCETYNPVALYFDWSPDHLRVISRLEESIIKGALFAFAMPRGSGKSTLCRLATLWAVSYAHVNYAFIIAANAKKAEENLDAVKTFMRFLPEYTADFPEISQAVIHLGGKAQGASSQHCDGEPTMIQWTKDRVVLPTVQAPPNLPGKHKLAPTSGCVIGASGLTGDGIRGSLFTTVDGRMIRPSFALLDDPQTDESAASPSQNATRERLISGAVLGMAGPGKKISAVMPCTVIRNGDMIDNLLNRAMHPLWRGERTRMLLSMPDNMDEWEPYFEVYRECMSAEPPDIGPANVYYLDHRAILDAGAEPSWPERKHADEISAIQHAMNLYARDPIAFFCEYQNDPPDEEHELSIVTAEDIAGRANGVARSVVPTECDTLTAFIDISERVLWWMVCGWGGDFRGSIVDYGVWPRQKTNYTTLSSAKITLKHKKRGAGFEAALRHGLTMLCDELLGREWASEASTKFRIERCLIDANWGQTTKVVESFCRRSPYGAVLMPSHGRGITASQKPLNDVKTRPKAGERRGLHWRVDRSEHAGIRKIVYDTNWWKSFVFNRFATAQGDPGALELFQATPQQHRMLVEQLTAEYCVRTEGRGRAVDEWQERKKGGDNHFLDCAVGCAVGASIQNVTLEGVSRKQQTASRADRPRQTLTTPDGRSFFITDRA